MVKEAVVIVRDPQSIFPMKILLLIALALAVTGCHRSQPKFDLPKEVFVHVDDPEHNCKMVDKVHRVWHCKSADMMPQKLRVTP
jgi:hypothetical protein